MLPSRPPNHSPRPLFRKKPTGYQLSWPVAAMLYEARDSVTNRLWESLGSGSKTISSFSISGSGGRVVENADEMAGLAPCSIGNLVTAARPIGGEYGMGRRRTHFRQHPELADL